MERQTYIRADNLSYQSIWDTSKKEYVHKFILKSLETAKSAINDHLQHVPMRSLMHKLKSYMLE